MRAHYSDHASATLRVVHGMLDDGAELVRVLLDVFPSFFYGFLAAVIDDAEGLVKLPLMVLLDNLAPVCMPFLLRPVYVVLADGEPANTY